MARYRRWYRFGALVVAIVLAVGAGASPAGGQDPDERDALIARQQVLINEQETLIAAQESLLNEYRCLFGIDTQLVSNGCPEPAQPTASPTPTATPTATASPTPTATPTATASPTPTATPTPDPTPLADPAIPAGTIEEQWEQLRQCNAGGDYQFSDPGGANFGVYQFRQTSWDDLARLHYPHLASVNPRDAAPADQDRMAYRLYEKRGWAPWPNCGASLPSLLPAAATPTPEGLPAIPAGTTQAQWDQLIRCESGGNYQAYNPAGPYLGAFQFHQSTWNGVANRNYPHLEGVDPRDAIPADQHRMAHALYEESGWGPWPACTASFRAA